LTVITHICHYEKIPKVTLEFTSKAIIKNNLK